jgi:hypothetical protein
LAVRTFQSSSGDAKLIRAAFCCLLHVQARENPANASFGDLTSRMTVFMVPPLDIRLEVRQEFVRAHELIIRLFLIPVSVVSLPALVVIPDYAYPVDHICQAVLIRMFRSRQRFEKTPKDKLSKAVLSEYDPVAEYFNHLHVGDYTNTYLLLSMAPTAMWRAERFAVQRRSRHEDPVMLRCVPATGSSAGTVCWAVPPSEGVVRLGLLPTETLSRGYRPFAYESVKLRRDLSSIDVLAHQVECLNLLKRPAHRLASIVLIRNLLLASEVNGLFEKRRAKQRGRSREQGSAPPPRCCYQAQPYRTQQTGLKQRVVLAVPLVGRKCEALPWFGLRIGKMSCILTGGSRVLPRWLLPIWGSYVNFRASRSRNEFGITSPRGL